MTFPPPKKLSSPELQLLRAKASKGGNLSPEEVASFVISSRASFLALPPPKSKVKKESKAKEGDSKDSPQAQIDFF